MKYAKHFGKQTRFLLWSGKDLIIIGIYFIILGCLLNWIFVVEKYRILVYIIGFLIALFLRTRTLFNSTISYDQAIQLAWSKSNRVQSPFGK